MTIQSNEVEAAIASRRSIRGFLPTPVPRDVVEHILDVAAHAPSGTNMQPWSAHVLTGGALRRFCDAVEGAFLAGGEEVRDYRYYPDRFFEPYLGRRRDVGWGLYGLLGIQRGDAAAMRRQHARNFRFFEAPIGMIFTIDRRLEIGSWLDYGMFLENICVAARGRGLDTCPQAAFASFPQTIRRELGLDEGQVVVCGMALGHADPDEPANALQTPRAAAAEFARFLE